MTRYSTRLAACAMSLIGLAAFAGSGVSLADTIVVYGATGSVGGAIVDEALRRGHDVIGVSRTPDAQPDEARAHLRAVRGDVTDPESIAATVVGADAVVIAVNGIGPGNTPDEAVTYRAARAYITAAAKLGAATPHVFQVGGGTTLYTEGVLGLESADLMPGTRLHGLFWGHWQAMEAYQASSGFDWTVMTAARGALGAGERTGKYRLGDDETLFDRNGSSDISREDFAIAVIDLAESDEARNRRVAVGPPY
jgi:putative NADH-flavin reductase